MTIFHFSLYFQCRSIMLGKLFLFNHLLGSIILPYINFIIIELAYLYIFSILALFKYLNFLYDIILILYHLLLSLCLYYELRAINTFGYSLGLYHQLLSFALLSFIYAAGNLRNSIFLFLISFSIAILFLSAFNISLFSFHIGLSLSLCAVNIDFNIQLHLYI